MKKEAEESGSTSTATENVVEKGEVEATKEGEKEKNEDNKSSDKNEKEASATDKEKDASNEQEVVFIQDLGFTVKIVSPGSEPFDIQVSSMELVQVIIRLPNDKIVACILPKVILFKLLIIYHILYSMNGFYQHLEFNLFYFQ